MTNSLKNMAIVLLGALLVPVALAVTDAQRDAISERIKPHGEVCVEGDSSCGAATASASAASGPRSGEAVYNAACVACHSTGAGGAPIVGNVDAWSDRIAKGPDMLHESGLKGVAGTGMIAKGGCMSCSDEEIVAAVDYMISQSE